MSTRPVTTTRATGLVVSRELREAFRRRSLWIIFAVLFLGSCAAMIVPELLDRGTDHFDVAVVGDAAAATAFEDALRPIVHAQGSAVRFQPAGDLEHARTLVHDRDADAAVVLGDRPVIVSRSGNNDVLVVASRQAIASDALA